MLTKKDKKIIAISLIILLITQSIIFASIPMDTDSEPIIIIVKNGTSLHNIADRLKNDGIISSSSLFMVFSLLYGGKLIAGEYELRKDMSILGILKKMGRGDRHIYALRIVEGYNLYNIADAIEKAEIMKRVEFLKLAKDKTMLSKLGITSDSLEGYLPPDTYYYSKEIEIEGLIEKIAQRTFNIFTKEDIKKRMEELNFDMHKTLTLASMIEREAKLKEEKPLISAVFHNRLKKDMSLDSDPTVIYGTGAFNSAIKKSHLTTYTAYNTYTFKGLPKGPICSPDKNSIMAALYPAAVEYLYFVSKNDGSHVFSKDMNEHNRFVIMYQRAKNTKK
ncbi:MAG: endolytic transglycosylase MltG [Proteobacteria bacterium]|nr:endolytic transglycosylase MltG [Pseudomonadota bacterium]